jgi:hypothetical protein
VTFLPFSDMIWICDADSDCANGCLRAWGL